MNPKITSDTPKPVKLTGGFTKETIAAYDTKGTFTTKKGKVSVNWHKLSWGDWFSHVFSFLTGFDNNIVKAFEAWKSNQPPQATIAVTLTEKEEGSSIQPATIEQVVSKEPIKGDLFEQKEQNIYALKGNFLDKVNNLDNNALEMYFNDLKKFGLHNEFFDEGKNIKKDLKIENATALNHLVIAGYLLDERLLLVKSKTEFSNKIKDNIQDWTKHTANFDPSNENSQNQYTEEIMKMEEIKHDHTKLELIRYCREEIQRQGTEYYTGKKDEWSSHLLKKKNINKIEDLYTNHRTVFNKYFTAEFENEDDLDDPNTTPDKYKIKAGVKIENRADFEELKAAVYAADRKLDPSW